MAVDKSLIAARGPQWHSKDRREGRIPPRLPGVDRDSRWAFSKHDGWVQGYSYEVVVAATPGTTVFPLLASAGAANVSEHASFGSKIGSLPRGVRWVLADSGYDNRSYMDAIEWDATGQRTGRRLVCPTNPRNRGKTTTRARLEQRSYYRGVEGKAGLCPRGQAVEPFNQWLKAARRTGRAGLAPGAGEQPDAVARGDLCLPTAAEVQPPTRLPGRSGPVDSRCPLNSRTASDSQ